MVLYGIFICVHNSYLHHFRRIINDGRPTYGDTHTNTVYQRGIWRKYVNPAAGFESVDAGDIDTSNFESFEEALDAKCQTDWKCLGYDYYFKFSWPGGLKFRKKLLYPGGKSPKDTWALKYEHYYGVVVD